MTAAGPTAAGQRGTPVPGLPGTPGPVPGVPAGPATGRAGTKSRTDAKGPRDGANDLGDGANDPGAGRRTVGPARRWWPTAAAVLIVLLGGVVIALLQARPPVSALDPAGTGPGGTHALADLLAGQGRPVTTVRSTAAALKLARPGTTLVVTSPQLLGPASLAALARLRASLFLVAPTAASLTRLAPAVTLAGPAPPASLPPRCTLPAARLAGPVDMGGTLLRSSAPGSWRCYPAGPPAPGAGPGGEPVSLVRYTRDGHTVTVLGTSLPLTNASLGNGGNAALALNLLATGTPIVWLVPPPGAAPAAGGSLASLVPMPVYLILAELCVAVLLAVAWRMRRFGPLVYEPMVAVVRASETVRGHGGLYRARRARDRAADVLRSATLARIGSGLGLPPDPPPEAVTQVVAARTGRDPAEVGAILFGPSPRDDAALVALAAGLDSLEGQVLIQ